MKVSSLVNELTALTDKRIHNNIHLLPMVIFIYIGMLTDYLACHCPHNFSLSLTQCAFQFNFAGNHRQLPTASSSSVTVIWQLQKRSRDGKKCEKKWNKKKLFEAQMHECDVIHIMSLAVVVVICLHTYFTYTQMPESRKINDLEQLAMTPLIGESNNWNAIMVYFSTLRFSWSRELFLSCFRWLAK